MTFVRFRLATLFGFVTLCCIALGIGAIAAKRVHANRRLLSYLGSKYGNLPWAGARYDHEAEIGELHFRSIVDDLTHGIVEVHFFQAFEEFDETALMLSRVPSIEVIRIDESDLSDIGIKHLCRLKNLQTLDVPWSSVTDAGLKELESLRKLKRLDIRYTDRDLTVEAVERFRRKRPEVELLEDASLTKAEAQRFRKIESGAHLNQRSCN